MIHTSHAAIDCLHFIIGAYQENYIFRQDYNNIIV